MKKTLKILHFGKFFPPDVGGIESVMRDLAQNLQNFSPDPKRDMKIRVNVLCASKNRATKIEKSPQNFRIYRAKTWFFLAKTAISPAMIKILQKIHAKYDIIHAHLPDPMAVLALFFVFFGRKKPQKIILHWHSDIIKQRFLLKIFLPLQLWILKRADAIIATSEIYREKSPQLAHVREKTVVIPIGITDQNPSPDPKIMQNRVLSVGRLAQNKNFKALILAMKNLPNFTLKIVGDGAERESLEAIIARENLSDRVFLRGQKSGEDLMQEYKNADIFALASSQESYGVVLVEALCFSLPIVCSRLELSGNAFINRDGETGFVVPPDPKNLSCAIKKITKNHKNFAKNARKRYEKFFTLEEMIAKTAALYQKITGF